MPRPTSRALPERTFEGQPLTGREERLREQSLRQGLTLKLRYDSNTSPSLRATVAFELAAFVAPTGERTAAEVRAWRTGRGYSYSTVRRAADLAGIVRGRGCTPRWTMKYGQCGLEGAADVDRA